jgi:2'-5' RNA ligase
MTIRYAVYFAPGKASGWQSFGAQWLGRSEFDLQPLPLCALDGITSNQLEELTRVPRRYGFHATLKAPFRLAPGVAASELTDRMAKLARLLRPLPLGAMTVVTLGNFVALVPCAAVDGLHGLAEACVTELDDLRAPLAAHELSRRVKEPLDARATELLKLCGDPHVLERYQMHFTLTGPVTAQEAARVTRVVTAPIERLNRQEPLVLDRLCLFMEPAADSAFLRIADFALGADA